MGCCIRFHELHMRESCSCQAALDMFECEVAYSLGCSKHINEIAYFVRFAIQNLTDFRLEQKEETLVFDLCRDCSGLVCGINVLLTEVPMVMF